MPKLVDAAEQRAIIRTAARAVFARRGVATAGLGHIAAEAGMSRTGVYHYYTGKAAVVRDLARELLADEERLFQTVLRMPGSVDERIGRLADGVMERFIGWRSCGRPLLEIWAKDSRRLRPVLRRLRRALASFIAEGQQRSEISRAVAPRETAALLVGLIDGLMLQVFIDPQRVPPSGAMRRALVRSFHQILARRTRGDTDAEPRRRGGSNDRFGARRAQSLFTSDPRSAGSCRTSISRSRARGDR